MRTLAIILLTIVATHILYTECGPHNPIARLATASLESAGWLLHQAFNVVE